MQPAHALRRARAVPRSDVTPNPATRSLALHVEIILTLRLKDRALNPNDGVSRVFVNLVHVVPCSEVGARHCAPPSIARDVPPKKRAKGRLYGTWNFHMEISKRNFLEISRGLGLHWWSTPKNDNVSACPSSSGIPRSRRKTMMILSRVDSPTSFIALRIH